MVHSPSCTKWRYCTARESGTAPVSVSKGVCHAGIPVQVHLTLSAAPLLRTPYFTTRGPIVQDRNAKNVFIQASFVFDMATSRQFYRIFTQNVLYFPWKFHGIWKEASPFAAALRPSPVTQPRPGRKVRSVPPARSRRTDRGGRRRGRASPDPATAFCCHGHRMWGGGRVQYRQREQGRPPRPKHKLYHKRRVQSWQF